MNPSSVHIGKFTAGDKGHMDNIYASQSVGVALTLASILYSIRLVARLTELTTYCHNKTPDIFSNSGNLAGDNTLVQTLRFWLR